MVRSHSPTVRRRRLAAELRRLRDRAQLTIEDVAEKLACSSSKISRIETGNVGVSPKDARELLGLYGVPGDEIEALVQLAKEARKRGWWYAYNEVFTGSFVGLESEAASLRAFQALLVPGQLQTEDYMRNVIRAARPDAPPSDVEKRVKARLARQQLLTGADPPQYWAVIDEAVLCRTVGSEKAMQTQLKRLVNRAMLPHVTIQVVPFSAGAHAGMEGAFLVLSFPERTDPDVVYVDNTTSGIYLEEPAEILRYTLMFDHLRAAALSPDETLARITDAVSRYS
jgi:transcriptional regulator with XRE-family HTH domain